MKSEINQLSRRDFVKSMGFISISFSWGLGSCSEKNDSVAEVESVFEPLQYDKRPDQKTVEAWIRVYENGDIEVLTGKIELGQGIRTAVAQMAAEELNTSIEKIHVSMAETDYTPDEGYTAGSRSIEASARSVRYAAATAREKLLDLAASNFQIEKNQLKIAEGKISSPDSEISFYSLLNGRQIEEEINENAPTLAEKIRKYVGQPVPRKDIEKMVTGELNYVHDLRFPGMLHARVIRPRSYTSELLSFDDSSLKNEPGFVDVVRKGSFLAVIGKDEYQCVKLREKCKQLANWSKTEDLPEYSSLEEHIRSMTENSNVEEETGDWQAALEDSAIRHKASFFKPYTMHAPNGPSCAVAKYDSGKLEIWCHSQGVYPLRRSLSELLKIEEENIHIVGGYGSGMYGHNSADDAATDAALIAMEMPGEHIRVQWMRDDDHQWEPYGTAMAIDLEAGLDQQGKITAWKCELWSDGHSSRPGGPANSLMPSWYIDEGHEIMEGGYKQGGVRNSQPYYDIGSLRVDSHFFNGPLRVSSLRGLGAYAQLFALESFMDELAEKADIDPMEFRLIHSSDPRSIDCMKKLQLMIQNEQTIQGEGIGYSFSRYKNVASYCAAAAKVGVNLQTGKVEVKKMWAVIDAGEVINPDGLKNITEGGMIQSASWALHEEVKFDKEHVTDVDWVSYPILRMEEVPVLEVAIIDRVSEPSLGAGEAVQGPATAAIFNAVYKATGKRVRSIPLGRVLKE